MRVLTIALLVAWFAAAAPGQTWTETGDAPALLPGQMTTGSGSLTTISGTLSSGTDADLYAIYIDQPANFSAQTCGGTSLDSALFLFDANGNGVVTSEDGCGIASWITAQFVTSPGLYYLAMSSYDYDPLNAASQEIWNDTPWGSEHGPDGPGAPGPLAGWGGGGSGGAYSIFLTGARYGTDTPTTTGACCDAQGNCTILSSAACSAAGGFYQGDNTVCDPNPCVPLPTGACCSIINGQCSITYQAACESSNGEYMGDNTTCEGVTCPAVGACCDPNNGNCVGTYTFQWCELILGKSWLGDGTSCEGSNPCPQPPTGACCYILDGSCFTALNQAACEAAFGEYQGDGTTCETVTCPPIGACCDPDDGRCVLTTTYTLCVTYWGNNWLGAGTTCDGENPCPQPPMGACCQPDGTCQYLNEYTCLNQTYPGIWQGPDTVCDPNPCPQPQVGACCFPGGGCLVIEDWQCFNGYGTFQGDGTTCCPNPCAQGGLPGWGDGFEDYAAGTLLYNVGGWTGWDDQSYAAGTVSAAQAHSGVHSIAVNDTADAIHPFSPVYDGGQWRITAWQYLPSNLGSTSYFVVNTYYQHGGPYFWGVELHFTPGLGCYDAMRDPSATTPVPLVYDQWVEIRIEVDFDAGYLGTVHQYYNNQLVRSGDWITGSVGQLAIANIDLYAPHSAVVYYDDIEVRPVAASTMNPQRPLVVGASVGTQPVKSTNLSGFPNVTWETSFMMPEGQGIDGAAGLPDGGLYLMTSSFTSKLYIAPYQGPAIYTGLSFAYPYTVSGLAYGRGRLYGFCNYATPMGIYEIDVHTGAMTLVADTGSRRFFGLDYNPVDGLLYGYDEYGSPSGLCSINIDTGVITHIASSVPAGNSAARGLACGDNKVYAVTVFADYPMFMYDLAQGPGGTWVAMSHPYPAGSNVGSAAAWVAEPYPGDMNCDGLLNGLDIQGFVLAMVDPSGFAIAYPDCTACNADVNEDGAIDDLDIAAFVSLLTGL